MQAHLKDLHGRTLVFSVYIFTKQEDMTDVKNVKSDNYNNCIFPNILNNLTKLIFFLV